MAKVSSDRFKELLKKDGYTYIVKSKDKEPIDKDFPNLPSWHKEEFDEWRHEILPEATVIRLEYHDSEYKLLINMGDADSNDGTFGAMFDVNNEKVLDLISSGDMESTVESLMKDDAKIADSFGTELSPYLEYFAVILKNSTELEYLVFKILVENNFLYEIDSIDERFNENSNDEENLSE